MVRNGENFILDKLDRALGFYRIYFDRKIDGWEIIYDTPNHLLSSAGIVLSKQYDGEIYFKVRKISYLPSQLRKPSEKLYLAKCKKQESPKDYPLQIAKAINDAFANIFTIDLVEVVKQVIPIYEIKVKGNAYILTSGTGAKGQIVFEKARYRDLVGGRKVKTKGATVTLSGDPNDKKEAEEVLDAIERRCKELLMYEESRFEIAQRLLRPKSAPKNVQKTPKKSKKEEKISEQQMEDAAQK